MDRLVLGLHSSTEQQAYRCILPLHHTLWSLQLGMRILGAWFIVIESEDDLLAAATADGAGGVCALPKVSSHRMLNELGSYSLLCATEN
jgi:hypothetical protein